MTLSPATLYLKFLGLLLLGYAFIGKGFAYLGFDGLYIGEVAMLLGVICFFIGPSKRGLWHSALVGLIGVFAFWGFLNTAPYVGDFGIVALRDAVVWGYGAFAVIVATLLLRSGSILRPIGWYGRWMPWFAIWAAAGPIAMTVTPKVFPVVPGTEIIFGPIKAGDIAVHLAGAMAFVMLGLHHSVAPARHSPWWRGREWVLWPFMLVGFIVVSSNNRGGMLSVLTSCALVFALRPARRYLRAISGGLFVLITVIALDMRLPVSDGREISTRQVLLNLQSVVSDRAGASLQGTKEWRLEWWNTIVGYTVLGDHFWTGKGYGINLADDDGFQVAWDASLRSPHNGHLTILARSGVPGFALWIALSVATFATLLRGHRRARRRGDEMLSRIYIWLLAYWMAFMVNASFDVYLEGPQGGIWFWSLLGFIIALDIGDRSSYSQAPPDASHTGAALRGTV